MAFEGSFSILKWNEEIIKEKSEGIKTSHASIEQSYTGSMVGESTIEFLMSYQAPTSAKFTGFESFIGVINGLRGTVTFQHIGMFENGVASSEFASIDGSATGELVGKSIAGNFKSGESGKAEYVIELNER